MTRRILSKKRVEIRKGRVRHGRWAFGGRDMSGDLCEYRVIDRNFVVLNKWNFQICVPDKFRKSSYIQVNPIQHPQRRSWANLERRSISFARCTKDPYRKLAYAKVTLADPARERNKIQVPWERRSELPSWIRGYQFRRKSSVTTTRGKDGNALVIVVKPNDYRKMIRFFLATKAWVLHRGFSLKDL